MCTEVGVIALKNDSKILESCRSKHEDVMSNNDELSKSCREISSLYLKHNTMCVVSIYHSEKVTL